MGPGNTYPYQKSKRSKRLYQKHPRKPVKQYEDPISIDAFRDKKHNGQAHFLNY